MRRTRPRNPADSERLAGVFVAGGARLGGRLDMKHIVEVEAVAARVVQMNAA
jgi:hypothetical protein